MTIGTDGLKDDLSVEAAGVFYDELGKGLQPKVVEQPLLATFPATLPSLWQLR